MTQGFADADEHAPEEDADEHAPEEDADEHAPDEDADAHLDGLDVGAGCTEIWEHLSERREQSGASN